MASEDPLRLFLQLSETQFAGLWQQQPLPEIAARWRWVPLIKKRTAHYNRASFSVTPGTFAL